MQPITRLFVFRLAAAEQEVTELMILRYATRIVHLRQSKYHANFVTLVPPLLFSSYFAQQHFTIEYNLIDIGRLLSFETQVKSFKCTENDLLVCDPLG